MALSQQDRDKLEVAVRLLEEGNFIVNLSAFIGRPIEALINRLPSGVSNKVQQATDIALKKALDTAIKTLGKDKQTKHNTLHKIIAAGTGIGGGAFGWASLSVELPVTTTLMLRSIAEIAASKGEDLSLLETRLECLKVFALGSKTNKKDEEADIGYYAIRAALNPSSRQFGRYVTKETVERLEKALVSFLSKISQRFAAVVSEKAAAQAAPVIGAVLGAGINTAFMDHFQKMAEGHFTVRQLERIYGEETVQKEFEEIANRQQKRLH